MPGEAKGGMVQRVEMDKRHVFEVVQNLTSDSSMTPARSIYSRRPAGGGETADAGHRIDVARRGVKAFGVTMNASRPLLDIADSLLSLSRPSRP